METTDFTPAPATEGATPAPRSWRPADYYSSEPRRPTVPRWLSLGCGGLAVAVLLVVFIGGAVLSTSAINEFMDMALGMTMGEVRGMYAKDLGAAEKKGFENEVDGVRKNLRDGAISVRDLDPLMQSIRAASGDNRIERPELEQMQAAARKINSRAKPR